METALFGTAAQLKALLDGGLDPNSKAPGGATLLMFAAPDVSKMKLLTDRGADPKAKSAAGYTALTVASMYRGSAEAIKLLLAPGAEAAPGTGVMFIASPLFLAAMAGDLQTFALLRAAGADPKRPMLLMGTFPNSPLFVATSFRDTAMARAILAAGGDRRETDPDGMTAMHWTALSTSTEMVRTLAAAGVPLDQPD